MKEFRCDLYGYDLLLLNDEKANFGLKSIENLQDIVVNCIFVPVLHDKFKKMTIDKIKEIMNSPFVLIDISGGFKEAESREGGILL